MRPLGIGPRAVTYMQQVGYRRFMIAEKAYVKGKVSLHWSAWTQLGPCAAAAGFHKPETQEFLIVPASGDVAA